MKTFLLAVILLAIGVAGMAVTILVKKDGQFPDGEISHNKELRRRGVICAKEEELRMWGKHGNLRKKECPEGGCEGCAFFEAKTNSDSED